MHARGLRRAPPNRLSEQRTSARGRATGASCAAPEARTLCAGERIGHAAARVLQQTCQPREVRRLRCRLSPGSPNHSPCACKRTIASTDPALGQPRPRVAARLQAARLRRPGGCRRLSTTLCEYSVRVSSDKTWIFWPLGTSRPRCRHACPRRRHPCLLQVLPFRHACLKVNLKVGHRCLTPR